MCWACRSMNILCGNVSILIKKSTMYNTHSTITYTCMTYHTMLHKPVYTDMQYGTHLLTCNKLYLVHVLILPIYPLPHMFYHQIINSSQYTTWMYMWSKALHRLIEISLHIQDNILINVDPFFSKLSNLAGSMGHMECVQIAIWDVSRSG